MTEKKQVSVALAKSHTFQQKKSIHCIDRSLIAFSNFKVLTCQDLSGIDFMGPIISDRQERGGAPHLCILRIKYPFLV